MCCESTLSNTLNFTGSMASSRVSQTACIQFMCSPLESAKETNGHLTTFGVFCYGISYEPHRMKCCLAIMAKLQNKIYGRQLIMKAVCRMLVFNWKNLSHTFRACQEQPFVEGICSSNGRLLILPRPPLAWDTEAPSAYCKQGW